MLISRPNIEEDQLSFVKRLNIEEIAKRLGVGDQICSKKVCQRYKETKTTKTVLKYEHEITTLIFCLGQGTVSVQG